MRHKPSRQVYSLLAYEDLPGFPTRIANRLIGAKRALLVGSTIWISPAMAGLLADKDRKARARVLDAIDVVPVDGTLEDSIREAF